MNAPERIEMSLTNFHVLVILAAIALARSVRSVASIAFGTEGDTFAALSDAAALAASGALARSEAFLLRRCREARIR